MHQDKKRRRQAMYDAALALVSHIGYTNAGTVEFLLDQKGQFYFLEMNTRLQVEHAVTEMITGLDLVEQQIRIAAGERLAFSQKDVQRRGHAIEARLYPEDPVSFMPTTGRISDVEEPQDPNIRIDSALFPGYEVTPFYDPMMGKIIAWGKSRKRAMATLDSGLAAFRIQGIKHNIPLIRRVLADEEFKNGTYTTLLLSSLSEQGKGDLARQEERETVAAVTAALGSLFGNATHPRLSQWKTYGRATQMTPRPGRGGRW